MAHGPAPQPNIVKLKRGNPGKRRINDEIAFERPPEPPLPPAWLDSDAKDEWERIIVGLWQLGVVTVVDIQPLAAYCVAFSQWKGACELINRMASGDDVMHGLLVKWADGHPRRNLLIRVQRDAAADMLRFASEFGFTAAARSRIAQGIAPPDTAHKFSGLID